MTLWAEYPTNLAKPGHIQRGWELEALLTRVANTPPTLLAYKTADETIISNGTYQDDDHLFITVEASGVYVYKVDGAYNSNDTAQFRQKFTTPSTSAFSGAYFSYFDQTNAKVHSVYTGGADAAITGLRGKATDTRFEFGGILTVGTTGGTLQWQWAQNTSNASNTTVRAATLLTATRVA